MTVDELEEIAMRFRAAIEATRKDCCLDVMRGFPDGCCEESAGMLGMLLVIQYKLQCVMVRGTAKCMPGAHYWNEINDIRIDITADQFKTGSQILGGPRVIVSETHPFHRQFTVEARLEPRPPAYAIQELRDHWLSDFTMFCREFDDPCVSSRRW